MENYLIQEYVQSCLGYVQAMQFTGVIKPESWASMEVADRFTK